jgi:predicted GNAT family N-acyltransferase
MTKIRIERFPEELDAQSEHDVLADARFALCVEIRHTVFTLGQGVSRELEFDGLDASAEHFLASRIEDSTATPIGTARLRIVDGKAKAERVAVLDARRGEGIGRKLMQSIEARARGLGLEVIALNAQVAVIPFYERLGYQAFGPVFDEAGIDHRRMSKTLDAPDAPSGAR